MIRLRSEASDGLKSVVSSEIPPTVLRVKLRRSVLRSFNVGWKLNLPLSIRAKRSFLAKENRSGFTLIEVLLAVAIIGIVLGPIYILQGTVFDRVMRVAGSVDRMLFAYDFFVDVKNGDDDHVKETIKDPFTDLVYEKKEPQKSSVLAKEFNHIYIKKLSWHWKYQDTSYSDVLVDFAFIPPEEKKEPEETEKKPSSVAQKAMAGQGKEQEKKPQSAGTVEQKAIVGKNMEVKKS
jgi:prepilin-type N-terminal cleavage/methylation domain-containing protein